IHALRMAQRRLTPRTLELLTGLSDSGGSGNEKERRCVSGYAAAALASHHCWAPVFRYFLRVGLAGLTVVEECFPEVDAPIDDVLLAEVLLSFRGDEGPTPGSILCVALAGRKDLLPEVLSALKRTETGSVLAGACLVAIQWLGDTDSASVPA